MPDEFENPVNKRNSGGSSFEFFILSFPNLMLHNLFSKEDWKAMWLQPLDRENIKHWRDCEFNGEKCKHKQKTGERTRPK